ncbi:hypothetical protein PO124_04505 [Bacillus licheniformis]|nr:hypothetical protein [Bacillus licheniformis]
MDEGYLQQDAVKRYRLGQIDSSWNRCHGVDRHFIAGRSFLKQLMDGVQETVFMAVLSDDQLVYIAKSITTGQSEQPHSPARANRFIAPGLARHFGIHAGGQREGLLDRMEFIRFTGHTITAREELESSCRHFGTGICR